MTSTHLEERIHHELKRRFRKVGAMKGSQAASRRAVVFAKQPKEPVKRTILERFKSVGRRT
ncbi:MAG: hypothetical protein ACO3JL_11235 [Myxococcota bacterium]